MSLGRSVLAVLALSLAGCCPCRHIATSTADSVRVEVVERVVEKIDTVEVVLPAERVEVVTPDTTSIVATSLATSTASVRGGLLHHTIENKRNIYRQPAKVEVVVRDSIVVREVKVEEIVEVERKITWWQRLRLDGFWVLLSALVAVVGWNFRNVLGFLKK